MSQDDLAGRGVRRVPVATALVALRVEVAIVRIFAGAILFRTRALVDGTLCAEGRLTLALPR